MTRGRGAVSEWRRRDARVGVGPQDAPPRRTRKAASSSNLRGCASRACPSTWAWSSGRSRGGVPKAALHWNPRDVVVIPGGRGGVRLLRRPTTNDARSDGSGSSKRSSRAAVCASTERRSRPRRRDDQVATHPRDRRRDRSQLLRSLARRRPPRRFPSRTRPRARHGTRGPASRARRAKPFRSSPLARRASFPPSGAMAAPLELSPVRVHSRSTSSRFSPRTTPIRASLTLPVFLSPSFPRPHAGGAP